MQDVTFLLLVMVSLSFLIGWFVATLFEEKSRGQYYELLGAVSSKFPNETRHQTDLRYIQESERAASVETCARWEQGE